MNTAIPCIILLACTAICISKPILKCRCLKTSRAVNASLIHHVEEYKPRQYCNKKEVIVVLKDKSSECLDPNTIFTHKVLKIHHMQMALRAKKMKTTRPKKNTASATTLATAAPTSSK